MVRARDLSQASPGPFQDGSWGAVHSTKNMARSISTPSPLCGQTHKEEAAPEEKASTLAPELKAPTQLAGSLASPHFQLQISA